MGKFENGDLGGLGCLEVKGKTLLQYITGNFKGSSGSDKIVYEMDKCVYIGEVDDKFLYTGKAV